MVKRTTNTGLEKFTGTVQSTEKEATTYDGEKAYQYHIRIDPDDIEVEGPTGLMHEWVPLSKKTTEEEVPENSVMDRYLKHIEVALDEAEDCDTLAEVFKLLEGKKFVFKRLKLGQSYNGNEARQYITPVQLKE